MLEYPLVSKLVPVCPSPSPLFFVSTATIHFSYRVHQGEDGPSQMALEDFAMFRSVATSTCYLPSDEGVSHCDVESH